MAAVLRTLRQLAPLRHPTRPAGPRPRPWPLRLPRARSGEPRTRRPARPRLPAVVRQDPDRTPRRPGHRRPPGPRRRRDRRARARPARRHRHPARRVTPVRVDRHPTRPRHLRAGDPARDQRATPLARPIRHCQGCGWGCGQPFRNRNRRTRSARHPRPRPHPMTRQIRAAGLAVRGERSESRSDTSAASALDGQAEGPTLPDRVRPRPEPLTSASRYNHHRKEDDHERKE